MNKRERRVARQQRPCSVETARANGKRIWWADKDHYARHQRDQFNPRECWRCGEPMR